MARPTPNFWKDGDAEDPVANNHPPLFAGLNTREAAALDYSEELVASKADSSAVTTALSLKQGVAAKGQVGGYASLDSDAKVPFAQLPAAVSYDCIWNDIDTEWMFLGLVITSRPNVPGLLRWLGGGADADPTPAGLNLTSVQGDVWIPSEDVE